MQRESDELLTIVKMLWADNNEASPLQLRIMDTIFYEQDQLSLYVYFEEPTQTLHRVPNKQGKKTHWIGDKFMKRRMAVERDFKGTRVFNSEYSVADRGKKTLKKLGKNAFDLRKQLEVAILKYKERYEPVVLRDSDLLAILHNPIYVNDKFKHLNNTLYIQRSAVDSTDLIEYHNIEYRRETFQNDWLYELAADYVCHHSSNSCPEAHYLELEEHLRSLNEYLYLHYTVFKIVVYVSMHHQTRIKAMTVTFLKDERKRIAISAVRGLSMHRLPHNRLEFQKAQVFPMTAPEVQCEFQQTKEWGLCDEIGKSRFYDCVNTVFGECNMRIHQDFEEFLQHKVDAIQNPADIAFSEECFRKLNPDSPFSLTDILNNQHVRAKLIRRKYPDRRVLRSKKDAQHPDDKHDAACTHRGRANEPDKTTETPKKQVQNFCGFKRSPSKIMSVSPTFPKSPNSLPELLFLTR